MDRRKFMQGVAAGALVPLAAGIAGGDPVSIDDPDALTARLAEKAREIFANNRVESAMGRFHLPSYADYKRFYAWDSGWNVLSLSVLDPPAAVDELEAVFNFQVEDGRVPHEAVPPETPLAEDGTFQRMGYDMFDEQGRSFMLDPPSFLVAAGELYRRRPDPRILALLPKMEKCLEYLLGPRDLFGEGLSAVVHRWEPGTDMAPSFDQVMAIKPGDPLAPLKTERRSNDTVHFYATLGWDLQKIKQANRFVLEDPGLNALTAAGASAVADLFQASGDPVREQKWRARAKQVVQAMEDHLWNDERGFFYPRFDASDPKLADRASLTGLVPLMTGLVSEDKALRVITQWLDSPKHFQAPWLVPFNSRSEMARDPATTQRGHLWRGSCIWINMNWMAARAARICGRPDLAREITRRTAVMVDRHGFREYYRPRTGRGVGAVSFTWPALVLPMIEEHGL